ncbi:hypothetical protein [Kitasatospora sp. NPDC087314]|uniref:hypothetical protein n=1 Tax=Kitasatospora sp. NPDC087314 TaxID=3364068 RepID=UPI00382D95A0
MVAFAQLRHSSFEALDRAGDTWSGVSGHMEQVSARMRADVIRTLTGDPDSAPPGGNRPWSGAAADEAVREIGLLADELRAFHYEALAVSAALHRAGSAFTEAGRRLLRAIGDAEALGATVAEDGTVTLPGLPPAERHDPAAVARHRRTWDELRRHVAIMEDAVSVATEADTAAAAALHALNPAKVAGAKVAPDDGAPGAPDRTESPGAQARRNSRPGGNSKGPAIVLNV